MSEKKTKPEKRSGIALTETTMKNVRKLRAKMELASGERTGAADAVDAAVRKALAGK